MRGFSKSLPKYAKHKASGEAVVRLSGVDFYLGPHGTKASHTEYDRRMAGQRLSSGNTSRFDNGRRIGCAVLEVRQGLLCQERQGHRVIVVGPKAQAVITKCLFRDKDEHCFIREQWQAIWANPLRTGN